MILFKKLVALLRSTRLALVLLIVILVSCLVGVVVVPLDAGKEFVFSSLWFNGLLTLLVVNTAFCFFRVSRFRTITVVSAGLIIFHASFVLLAVGIVYNNLFFFKGAIRLTEGETLRIGESQSYDWATWGRFFDHGKLMGRITLHKLYPRYLVNGKNKGVANALSIDDGARRIQGVAYTTHHVAYKGFRYFRARDGFSPLIILGDRDGNELYGAYVPLQSIPQENKENKYLYTTGTASEAGSIPFPPYPTAALFNVQIVYHLPIKVDGVKRVSFRVWQRNPGAPDATGKELLQGEAALGEKIAVGDYVLSMKAVRYWASLDVHYSPGLPLILSSFWVGLGGIALTTITRIVGKPDKQTLAGTETGFSASGRACST